ncbi:MAG: TonB-dependent receptor [Halieaceae bacterium]|nr:TonB-dependent receptor [Halieaceae bacterium]
MRGAASGGVTDKLSLRLALGKQEQGGFQRNTLTGTTDNRTNTTARFQGLYDQSDTLTILGSIQYTKREQDALLQKNISTLPDGAIMPLFGSPIIKFAANDDFRDYPITHDGGIDFDTVMATLRIEKEFGGFNLVATSGYLDGDGVITQDFDGNEAAIAIIPGWEEEYDTLSQEIRLVGKNWLVGVYYYSDDAASSYVFDYHAESLQGLLTRGAGKRDNVPIEVETTSWAAFGEYTLDFSEQWALSLGGRYSTDEKDWVLAGETTLPGLPVVLAPYVYDDGDDWDSFDPKVALKYRVNDDVLAYFTYNEGYKAGGVQFTAITEALARQVFDPEELSAYELGVKSDLMDNTLRVNATAFYYDYQDLQVQRVDTEVSGGLPVAFTSNAAESEISGLELDINWLPNEALDFRLAYAYLHTEYVDYIGPGGVDFSGNPLPNSPKHTLIGSIGYTTTLPGNWTLNLGTDWTFTDEHNFDVLDDDPFTKEDSYTLGAARLAVISPDQKWTVTAYVKNLTDEEYYSQMTRRSTEVIASAADGRRYGLRVRYDF